MSLIKKDEKLKIQSLKTVPLRKEDRETEPLDFTELKLEENNNRAIAHYHSLLGGLHEKTNRKYSVNQLLGFLDNPRSYSKQLVDASKYLSASSSYYMRLMYYISRMLTLDHVTFPNSINRTEMIKDKEKVEKQYLEALNFINSYHIKHEFGKILFTMAVEDVFYGYERRKTSNGRLKCTIQPLPSDFCKITGVEDGIFTFSFNMGYFGLDIEKLQSFPRSFMTMYKEYLETGEPWQPVNPKKGVCFKFRDDLDYIFPPFSAVMPDILDHQETKDLLKSRNRLENFKLLLQKIPFKKDARSEKDYLINLKSVTKFHNNIKSVLPDEIGLITSPMEIEEYSFEKKNNTLDSIAKQGKEEIFDSAGMPSGLFATGGNRNAVALIKAIQTDEAIVFHVLRQFERFFNNRLSDTFKDMSFQVMFPDLTVYNREDKTNQYLQLAQYGVATKFMVASSIGLSATQLVGGAVLENDILGLDELLVPLQSSHTSSGSGKESGGQTKSINQLSDKGAETRDMASNKNRVK